MQHCVVDTGVYAPRKRRKYLRISVMQTTEYLSVTRNMHALSLSVIYW